METFAKEGKYIFAEQTRINAEKLKKDLDLKKNLHLKKQHKEEGKEVKKYLKEDLASFQAEWKEKLAQKKERGDWLRTCLKKKHEKEWE